MIRKLIKRILKKKTALNKSRILYTSALQKQHTLSFSKKNGNLTHSIQITMIRNNNFEGMIRIPYFFNSKSLSKLSYMICVQFYSSNFDAFHLSLLSCRYIDNPGAQPDLIPAQYFHSARFSYF